MGRRMALAAMMVGMGVGSSVHAQKPVPPPPVVDDSGPTTDNGSIVIPKKKEPTEVVPAAPAEEKVKNPDGEIFSLRVDASIVNLNVNVILDKNHQFVPGLKADNFLVLEDGVEQEVQTIRVTQTPITAVMLLEFASNSYAFIRDMQVASDTFFRSLKPDDYIAVITYDLRTHILTDFTNNKDLVRQAIQSLDIPGFSDTNEFDALYETLDRMSRIEGRKYVVLISSGRDTFSKLTLDKMLAKIKATPNVTIFTISTGGLARELAEDRNQMGSITRMDYLQADNQMRTFAAMTGGLSFQPKFQGELPDIFGQINESIRNQYVLTYRPTNTKNDGSYRKIKVMLVDKEGKPLRMADEKGKALKYSVIARDGYKGEAAGGVGLVVSLVHAVVALVEGREAEQEDAGDEDAGFELDGEVVEPLEVLASGRGEGSGGDVAAEGEAVSLHAGHDGELGVAGDAEHGDDDEDFERAGDMAVALGGDEGERGDEIDGAGNEADVVERSEGATDDSAGGVGVGKDSEGDAGDGEREEENAADPGGEREQTEDAEEGRHAGSSGFADGVLWRSSERRRRRSSACRCAT